MAKPLSLDLRKRVVHAYEAASDSMAHIAGRFGVGVATVNRWVNRYRKTGLLAPLAHAGGPAPKVDERGLSLLSTLLDEQPDATRSEVAEQYRQHRGISLSVATVGRDLRRLGLTRKKTFHATERDSERVKQARRAHRLRFSSVDREQLVFIDESGSNLAMAREYGRAPSGVRVEDDKPYNHGENVSLVGALGLGGLRTLMTLGGAVDGVAFVVFVRSFLAPTLRRGDIVVMDNLSVHKVKGVREAIEATGATLCYLPPYSPDLNPIERCWSKLKALLKSAAARTREALDAAIAEAMEAVTAADAAGWFAHGGYQPV